MGRRLFCDICPLAYSISYHKQCLLRSMANLRPQRPQAKGRLEQPLPYVVYCHKSLIRRRLGEVDPQLQENKAVNLSIAAPKVNGVIIRPGEEFSFWGLVGSCTKAKGYLNGLTIANGTTGKSIGGGMCQFTNLIHWLVLHSPLEVTEYHHHDKYDLFPDFGRVVPFGVGTSILYNYLDYRFYNLTQADFQLLVEVKGEYLWGELRCSQPLTQKFHIETEGEAFVRRADGVYRLGRIYRLRVDKATGNILERQCIKENNALVCYDESYIRLEQWQTYQQYTAGK